MAFYHQTIRSATVAFASMFSGIQLVRTASDGASQTINVPIQYSGKQAFVQRLFEQPDLDAENVYQSLPRMAFNITSFAYDGERKMPRMGKILTADGNTEFYNPTPYTMSISLNIIAKNVSDCFQIIEQILPSFSPERVLTINVGASGSYTLTQQIPFILKQTQFQNDFEGTLDKRQLITAELQFDAKLQLYGVASTSTQIHEVIVNINDPTKPDYQAFGSPMPTTTYTASASASGAPIIEGWIDGL